MFDMIVFCKLKWSEDNELLKSKVCNNTSFHSLNSGNKELKEEVKDANWLIFTSFFL